MSESRYVYTTSHGWDDFVRLLRDDWEYLRPAKGGGFLFRRKL